MEFERQKKFIAAMFFFISFENGKLSHSFILCDVINMDVSNATFEYL